MDSEFDTVADEASNFLTVDPVATFEDRREHPRTDYRATISIVMSKRPDQQSEIGDFCLLHGLTNNISKNGISLIAATS